jgi:plasmid stabilization system protein ParE
MPASGKRRLEWSRAALAAYEATLERIAGEDPFTAERFQVRVAKSLVLIQSNPELGTPSSHAGRRVHAVPGIGHSLSYRVKADAIFILRWYRQRRNIRP